MLEQRSMPSLMKQVKSWASPQLYRQISELIKTEPEYVGKHALFIWPKTPTEFLAQYGFDDPDTVDDYRDEYGWADIDVPAQPIRAIQQVLVNSTSWGEFIGGVIGAIGNWKKRERVQTLPYLHTAVLQANLLGVDH